MICPVSYRKAAVEVGKKKYFFPPTQDKRYEITFAFKCQSSREKLHWTIGQTLNLGQRNLSKFGNERTKSGPGY